MNRKRILLAILMIFSPLPCLGAPDSVNPEVPHLLNQGLFRESGPAPTLPAELGMAYQPMVVTMVASVKSREPARTGSWETLEMPSEGMPSSCEGSLQANFRRSASGSSKTFVIFPGSHSNFSTGGYSNQISALLASGLQDPNVIALNGFQSASFLQNRCRAILWNTTAVGADLHRRIGTLLRKLGLSGAQTGVIGFSGGATLAVVAMAQDRELLQHGADPVFGLGGLSFSPILDGRTTFGLLDSRHQLSTVEKSEGLLTYTWHTATRSLWHLLWNGWKAFNDMYQKRPQEFLDRAYNEFTVGFLAKAMAATGLPSSELGDNLSYYHAYVELGFQQETGTSNAERDAAFDRATDLRPALKKISRPLLIYFSKDDPILSSYQGSDQPDAINTVLRTAANNPHIFVFNPKFGGHAGALLDPIFPNLVTTFFKQK